MFYFENIYGSIGFMVSQIKNLKNFTIIKVGTKYVWNRLAIFFSNLLLPYKLDIFWLNVKKVTSTF
jgi:hypothetical protein